MLLNGILTNSEVWIGLNVNHYRELEQVDEYLLREIFKAHSKDQLKVYTWRQGQFLLGTS